MTKVVLFNGPPSSGKDTLANQLANRIPKSLVVKFAAPLKKMAMHMYCDSNSQKFHEFDAPERKNTPDPVFLGKSCRQVQIDISEVYMKPMHGEDVFGKFLAKTIDNESENYDNFFVSDSGFRPEAEVLINEYGPQNVLLLRLIREGKTYEGDSRNYINLDDLDVKSFDIQNIEGDVNTTVKEVEAIINKFLKGELND